TKRSASRKSFLGPRRPRLDKACAKCSVPDIPPAAARLGHLGFQYRSSAPQAGVQYCVVDPITTSLIYCSISHSDSARDCSGLLSYQRRSGYRRSQRGETTHHLFARPRTLRIKLTCGFNSSTVPSISPLHAVLDYCLDLSDFHEFRGPKALINLYDGCLLRRR